MADPIIKELQVDETSAPMILVIGQTGAGKSHFINKVAGEKVVKESARLFSCTTRPELVEVKVDDNDFLMVDTPGFNDTWRDSNRSDAKILGEIARMLTLQTQMGVRLRGILFLYDIGATRMTGDNVRQIEMIKRICGENNYSNVMLVTTHWPQSVEEQKERGYPLREADLRKEFWRNMIKGGSKMWRFDNETSTARAIVRSLAAKPNITLALQEELASGKGLSATSAGSYIINSRQDDENNLKSKAKDLAKDPSNAELLQDIGRLQTSIDSRKAAEGKLQDDIVTRIRKEIRDIDDEARPRSKKPTAAGIIRWLIGISELTAQVVQAVFSAT